MEGAAGFGDEFGASTAFEEFGETQAFGDDPLDGASVFEQTDQQLDEVPDTFEGGSQQLPNVDSNEMGKSKDTGGSQAGHTDPGQWSARTQKVRQPRLPALCVTPGVLPPTPPKFHNCENLGLTPPTDHGRGSSSTTPRTTSVVS